MRYGDLIGVSDVSLEVPAGSVVALLGSNGGGKTTALNAIAGLIPVHSRASIELRRRGDRRPAAPLRSCARAWRCRRRAGGCSCSRASRTICCSAPRRCATRRARAALLERVYECSRNLKERRSQRAGTMSGGERQMLAVGRALMSDPKLLMLDEPSLGLAPAVVESMYETFGRAAPRRADHPARRAVDRTRAGGLRLRHVLQVGKSVLSGTAAALAQDPQVQKAYLGA